MQVRADSPILREEAQSKLKEAMASYPGDPRHVTIYALNLSMTRNDLVSVLSREDGVTSYPPRISRITEAVDEHLRHKMLQYLDIS